MNMKGKKMKFLKILPIIAIVLLAGRCKFLSVKSKEPEILRFWAL